jgi:predicted TIM-barrel fold metal-dependent hydrolase
MPEPPAFPLLDVHAYAGTPSGGGDLYGTLSPEDAERQMGEAGIAVRCVFPPRQPRYAEANAALRRPAQQSEGRLLAFARLGGISGPRPIHGPAQAVAALRARLAAPEAEPLDLDGFAGVLLRPHTDGLPSDAAFREVADRELPVLVHAGQASPPDWIAQHVVPKTTGPVILQHLGSHPGDAQLLRAAVTLAETETRVYLDTAVPSMAAFVRYAADCVPGKLLFGSGAPVLHPATAWAHVAAALPGDDGLLRAVGWENGARLFGLPEPATFRP